MHRQRVAVLYGGVSPEHDVSVQSGRSVLEELPRERYLLIPLLIDRAGRWHMAREPALPPAWGDADLPDPTRAAGLGAARALEELQARGVDIIFIALHGHGGEDGSVQSLLDSASLRYTGSGPAASAIAMRKSLAKAIVRSLGLPVPDSVLIATERDGDDPAHWHEDKTRFLSFPCFVKPNGAGSSVGTQRIEMRPELPEAVAKAAAADPEGLVLIEEMIAGRELSAGVIGRRGEERSLPPVEIRPVGRPFFDYVAKYTPGRAEELCPAPIDGQLEWRVREMALQIHRALGCEGFSRVDFIARDGVPYFLEVNTIPGLTRNSLLPRMAAAEGTSFAELLEQIVAASRGTRRGAGD
ncbi:MAG: D-alanine--D-alanine ligase [Planctomycetota bacterium]